MYNQSIIGCANIFTIRASGMVYKRLRVAFRFEEVEPGGGWTLTFPKKVTDAARGF